MFAQAREMAIAMREAAMLAVSGFMLMTLLAAIGATMSAPGANQADTPPLALEVDRG